MLPFTRDATLEALQQCERRYFDLSLHLNSFAPINTLPIEVLSDVFLFVVREHFSRWLDEGEYPQSYEEIYDGHTTLALVCQQWKSILSRIPSMWSYIYVLSEDNLSQKVVETMLVRSAQTPLTVVVDSIVFKVDHPDFNAMIAILNQLHRIKDLRFITWITLKLEAEARVLTTFTARPAPLLRSLVLSSPETYWPFIRVDSDDHQKTRVVLPCLQDLKCTSFLFKTVRSLLVPTLTRLVLHDWLDHVFAHDLLQALRHIRFLRYLELNSMWVQRADLEVKYEITHLQHLHDLVLVCSGSTRIWLKMLEYLSFPSTTRLSLTVLNHGNGVDYGVDFIPYVQSLLQRIDYHGYQRGVSWPFLTLVYSSQQHAENNRHSSVILWNEDAREETFALVTNGAIDQSHPVPFMSLDFYYSGSETLPSALSLPTSGIHTLIVTPSPVTVEAWRDTFGHMEHVEALCVMDSFCLPSALAVPTEDPAPSIVTAKHGERSGTPINVSQPLFPKLKTLLIFIMADKGYWENLRTMLLSRSRGGIPVQKLILVSRGVLTIGRPSPKVLTEIRDIVDVVVESIGDEDVYKAQPKEIFWVLRSILVSAS